MKKYEFNQNIDMFEVDPGFLDEGLAHAKKQRYSRIRIRSQNMDYGTMFDIDFGLITDSQFITGLTLADNIKVGSDQLDSITNLKKLTYLSFAHPCMKIDFQWIPWLEELVFTYNKGIKNLDSLTNLKMLKIRSFKCSDCKQIGHLAGLKTLEFTQGTLASLSGIEAFTNLGTLSLKYLPKLADAEAVNALEHLETLHIEKCKRLRDFSFLAGHRSLRELFVSELDSVSFIETMPKVEKFWFWSSKEGNMTPLLKAPKLKNVHFYPNKKHYSHKKEEILEMLNGDIGG